MDKKMSISGYIDYTNLSPTVTEQKIKELCQVAEEKQYNTVCVPPYFVKMAKKLLKKSVVKVCTVVGFPLGYYSIDKKVAETKEALKNGADEIDMVLNISEFKNKKYEYCIQEINTIKKILKTKTLKVIVETAYLDKNEKALVAKLILESDADFIKTSTGFAPSGATEEDIVFFKEILGGRKQIKASGGIRTVEEAENLISKGASRIGTSAKL